MKRTYGMMVAVGWLMVALVGCGPPESSSGVCTAGAKMCSSDNKEVKTCKTDESGYEVTRRVRRAAATAPVRAATSRASSSTVPRSCSTARCRWRR